MSPKQRLDTVLAGHLPDRPPFSFWYHFPPDQVAGDAALHAHLDQLDRYHMDFLKVMNDNPYPHPTPIRQIADLASLTPLRGDEDGFGQQLELLSALHAAAGHRVYIATTLFNAWMVLRLLVEPHKIHRPPNLDAAADHPSHWMRDACARQPALIIAALHTIGDNLARFAAQCLHAGADAIFLSVRDDWVDTPETPGLYDRLVRPTDQAILQAASAARFNILHVCGKAVHFRAFADYPVSVLHWADRAAGPPISQVAPWLKPTLAGGVDNLATLVTGTPDEVRAQVADALRQAGQRPLIIAPGCTFDPQRVPPANLAALAAAVRQAGP